ncbi:MAG: hypothetical protein SGARI_005148, partial [Bacillariaceae sp.]
MDPENDNRSNIMTEKSVDSSIVQQVEEIDEVLEEMRELSALRGIGRGHNGDDSQSEVSTDVNGYSTDKDLALELSQADASFVRQSHNNPITLPFNPARPRSYDESSDGDVEEDTPIAVAIGEQQPQQPAAVVSPALNPKWLSKVHKDYQKKKKNVAAERMKRKFRSSSKTKNNHDLSYTKQKRKRLLRISMLLMTTGFLVILITALLVMKRTNNTSEEAQFASSAAAAESNLDTAAIDKSQALPTASPSRSPTRAPTRHQSRFPSIAPVVSGTELPTS